MPIQPSPPVESQELVQGSGTQATKATPGGVVTAAQLSAGATAPDTIVIGAAAEAFDNVGGGSNALVGVEGAVVDLDDDDDRKPHFGFDSVAKVRMDFAPVRWFKGILGLRRKLFNSAGYRVSAQPETAYEGALRVEPGAVAVALLQATGNPGVLLAEISGDMVEWHDGKLYWPVNVDGVRWGVPLAYLGKAP